MSETFGMADLVAHKDRPGSYGLVDAVVDGTLIVIWDKNGRHVHVWGVQEEWSAPEECKAEDLKHETCPGCGEDQCWCGVGR